MSLALAFFPGVAKTARAVYRKTDFALEYAVRQRSGATEVPLQSLVDITLGIREPRWLGIADTLVMTFAGADADFVAFDAYTNIDLWTHTTELALPNVIDVGRVSLAAPPPDIDRIGLGVVPRFHFSPSQGSLLITLGRSATKHYRISTCLVVGIAEGTLASLQLSDVSID